MYQTFNENSSYLQSELLRHGELNWLTRDTSNTSSRLTALAVDQYSASFGTGLNSNVSTTLTLTAPLTKDHAMLAPVSIAADTAAGYQGTPNQSFTTCSPTARTSACCAPRRNRRWWIPEVVP